MLLLAKSVLFSSYSGKRKRRESKPDNRSKQPRGHPTGTKCYIYNQEGYQASEYPIDKLNNKGNKRKTYQFGSSVNITVDYLQFLGKHEVDKILIATYDLFFSTGILLDYNTIAHIFTNKHYFSIYVNSVDEFMTIRGHNHVSVAN